MVVGNLFIKSKPHELHYSLYNRFLNCVVYLTESIYMYDNLIHRILTIPLKLNERIHLEIFNYFSSVQRSLNMCLATLWSQIIFSLMTSYFLYIHDTNKPKNNFQFYGRQKYFDENILTPNSTWVLMKFAVNFL